MKSQVRLEILKLVHRHDYSAELIIDRAKKLEEWLESECDPTLKLEGGTSKKSPGRPKKSSNVDPLD